MSDQVRVVLERLRHFAMPDGPAECRGTWVRQKGEMRFAPDRSWLPFEAEQWFEGDGVEFRWLARVRMAPLIHARVVDQFKGGRGSLTARVLGVIPVARSVGPATDKGEAMGGLAELPWQPFAFRESPSITWSSAAPNRLGATCDDGMTRAAVEFEIDAEGRCVKVTAPGRPRMVGKTVVDTAWSGAVGEYRTFGRLRVPTVAEVAWDLPEGPFTYWRARVLDFKVPP